MNTGNRGRRRFGWNRLLIKAAAAAVTAGIAGYAVAEEHVKLGVLLPYTGTYAQLGEMITDGMKLAIEQNGGKLGGREVKYAIVDSEADPGKAPINMQKLIAGEKADFVVGPVHSGVAMGMVKAARDSGTILIIPNAGLAAATRQLCAPNIFRTSFTNWQPNYAMGKPAYDRGLRNVVTISWRYAAGDEHLDAFEEAFKAQGGKIVKRILVPFPDVEFQAQLTEIAKLRPDAVYAFFAGGGAVKFVKDYAAAGLKDKIPLLGAGFLTDGTLDAQGDAAEGIVTGLHYADRLDNPADKAFRAAFKQRYGKEPDIYAVQGYDTGKLLVQAMAEVKGDTRNRNALIAALERQQIDSPRGTWRFSKAHNPIQDIYLREVKGGENIVIGLAAKSLEDPGTGCRM